MRPPSLQGQTVYENPFLHISEDNKVSKQGKTGVLTLFGKNPKNHYFFNFLTIFGQNNFGSRGSLFQSAAFLLI